MPKVVEKLTEARVRTFSLPGLYPDGRGLYLQVTARGAKSWIFRFTSPEIFRPDAPQVGKTRDHGLGSLLDLNLTEARGKATEARALLSRGVDPIEEKKRLRASGVTYKAQAGPTFRDFAEECIEGWKHDWKNDKHAAQWRATLEQYAYPVIGDMPVAAIETKDVLAVISPYWRTKSETMSRVRGRIERVLAAASVEGLRQGNPALWKGHLSEAKGLGKKRKAAPFTAMPYRQVPSFLIELRSRNGIAAQALEFLILCAARTGEVRFARWSEIDDAERTWSVPPDRMKAGRLHVVPLPDRAMEILAELRSVRDLGEKFIFPGLRVGAPLSNMVFLKLLRRMGYACTAHGFRSCFKTWAEQETHHANGVIEAALAHLVGDKVERSYMRGDWFEKRRALMNDWEKFITSAPAGNILEFQARTS